jgi:hypothetical protein
VSTGWKFYANSRFSPTGWIIQLTLINFGLTKFNPKLSKNSLLAPPNHPNQQKAINQTLTPAKSNFIITKALIDKKE